MRNKIGWLRLPSSQLLRESRVDLFQWQKRQGDLVRGGEVILRAHSGPRRYEFTLPVAQEEDGWDYRLDTIKIKNFTRAVGGDWILGRVICCSPTEDDQKEEKVSAEGGGEGNSKAQTKIPNPLPLPLNWGQLPPNRLFALWKNSCNKDDGDGKERSKALLKELSQRRVSQFSPWLVSELVDSYPHMDAFFSSLIVAASASTQNEATITQLDLEVKWEEEKPRPLEVEQSALELRAWLLNKGGSSPMHKMGDFYAQHPEAGAVIQRLEGRVSGLTRWFTVEKNARGNSLKVRVDTNNNASAVVVLSPDEVAAAMADFLRGKKGAQVKLGQFSDFYLKCPAAKPVLRGKLEQFVASRPEQFEIKPGGGGDVLRLVV